MTASCHSRRFNSPAVAFALGQYRHLGQPCTGLVPCRQKNANLHPERNEIRGSSSGAFAAQGRSWVARGGRELWERDLVTFCSATRVLQLIRSGITRQPANFSECDALRLPSD